MQSQKTVFVGLSGGVDSSVAALRLKHAGYTVVGVFIKVWQPEFLDCNWEAERLDAMRVAAHLDIPFLTCDAEEAYKREVADYFIAEYKAGRTPNPDVMCNKAVKFGAFLDFARARGADFVATGHYAQKQDGNSQANAAELHRGVDTNKDQSYFLWTLTQDQLTHILLPVGDSPKEQIRREAETAGIPVATKKDSQGVCFLGHIDIAEFLSHYIDLKPGNVLNTAGEVMGTHKGAFVYTLGQRHGFTILEHTDARTPHFVVAKDVEQNTITVSTAIESVAQTAEITLEHTNWITEAPQEGVHLELQTRYRQSPLQAKVVTIAKDSATLVLCDTKTIATKGQSCVLYQGMNCLGGGIIA